jgi:hypothetical protein
LGAVVGSAKGSGRLHQDEGGLVIRSWAFGKRQAEACETN